MSPDSSAPLHSAAVMADWLAALRFEDLPSTTVEAAKRMIVDTIGVSLAGASTAGVRRATDMVVAWGGCPQAPIWGTKHGATAHDATFINAASVHSLDFDEIHTPSGVHSMVAVLPSTFGVARRFGPVDGKSALTAVVGGLEICVRLAMSLVGRMDRGFLPSSLCGVFGAASAAGKIAHLDAARLLDSFGLAYAQLSGNRQAVLEGTLSKRFQPAFAARAGVISSEMAERGISGPRGIFSGTYGLNQLYAKGEMDFDKLTNGLGNSFAIESVSVKAYPCCSRMHPSIDGALMLRERYGFRADEIAGVNVRSTLTAYELAGHPFVIRDHPDVDAQFSIPYGVAVALTRGQFGIADVSSTVVAGDESVQRLAKLVKVTVDETLQAIDDCDLAVIEVQMNDGSRFSTEARDGGDRCSLSFPLSGVKQKFMDCVAHTAPPQSFDAESRIMRPLLSLQDLEDITSLPI